jgi:hypothetical protein
VIVCGHLGPGSSGSLVVPRSIPTATAITTSHRAKPDRCIPLCGPLLYVGRYLGICPLREPVVSGPRRPSTPRGAIFLTAIGSTPSWPSRRPASGREPSSYTAQPDGQGGRSFRSDGPILRRPWRRGHHPDRTISAVDSGMGRAGWNVPGARRHHPARRLVGQAASLRRKLPTAGLMPSAVNPDLFPPMPRPELAPSARSRSRAGVFRRST